jgi:hypothetical protein
MSAFNVVRFRTKPGRGQDFIEAHRKANAEGFTGARRFVLIRTGDSTFCAVGEWDSFNDIVNARPKMIGLLDSFRDMLEDLGAGLGVTDPISGEAVLEMGPPAKKARSASGARRKKPAKRKAKSSAKRKAGAKVSKRKPAKKAAKRKGARKRR